MARMIARAESDRQSRGVRATELAQTRVEEAVAAVLAGQALAARAGWRGRSCRRALRRRASGVRARKASTCCSFSALRIEQVAYSSTPPGASAFHSDIEQARLRGQQRREVGFASVQQHVGLAAHDAGGRARRIDQHRVERRAVPPALAARQASAARRRALSPTPQAREGAAHAVEARRIDVQRGQAQRRSRSSRCAALPPGAAQASSTRAPARQRQGIGHALRRDVLHRHRAFGETGQRGDGQARVQTQCLGRRCRRSGDSMPASSSRCRYASRDCRARFTRSHNGGACALASRMAHGRRGQSLLQARAQPLPASARRDRLPAAPRVAHGAAGH